jgi:hypothetical protein
MVACQLFAQHNTLSGYSVVDSSLRSIRLLGCEHDWTAGRVDHWSRDLLEGSTASIGVNKT